MNKDIKTIEQDNNNNNYNKTIANQSTNPNRFQENPIMTIGNIYDPNHLNYLQSI